MVEKLVKAGHLRRYVRELDHGVESGQVANRITANVTTQIKSRLTINYILGGPSDDQYQSKHQQNKLLRVTTVKARVNAIHMERRHEETKPIDGPIAFPPVNPSRIIVPHYDALVLTLYINGFGAQSTDRSWQRDILFAIIDIRADETHFRNAELS